MTGVKRPPMSEAALQRSVVDLARSLGWGITQGAAKRIAEEAGQYGVDAPPLDGLIFHPRYSLGSEPGWPDLTLIRRRDRRLVFAELKTTKGVVSQRQAEVLDLLRVLEYGRVVCGEGPHERDSAGVERRLPCCWPWIQVALWRPADLESGAIAEVLQ